MAADPLDDLLRDRLSDYTDPGDPQAWPEMARRLDEAMGPDPAGSDSSMGDLLKGFEAPGPVSGWERIASTLDQADRAFDETLRRRVSGFEAVHDERAWGRLLAYWQDSRYLRIRLVMIKGIEAMALLLLLLASIRYDWIGPSTHPRADSTNASQIIAQADPAQALPVTGPVQFAIDHPDEKAALHPSAGPSVPATTSGTTHQPATAGDWPLAKTEGQHLALITSQIPAVETDLGPILPLGFKTSALLDTQDDQSGLVPARPWSQLEERVHPAIQLMDEAQPMNSLRPEIRLASLPVGDIPGLDALARATETWPQATPGPTTPRGRPEISAYLLTDVSALRMPEERIFSIGQQVVFPEKRMVSQGYGGGFTIATGHPRYALEMGIQYSARTFRPGRRVTLGDAFDNSTVDFQALRLQLVSIPIQARYRLDRTGRIRTYAAAGMTFTVVAQSDLDVVASYNFNSLSPGEDPNADPVLARTIRETRRISEHLRDGAPFSSKNYVSLQGGFGLEYILHPSRKLFVQALAQYQIPNLEFSNHNGKDLRAIAIQAGLRSSLGY